MKKQSGFTLIELLLVLAIIGIISAIAIPALLSQRARARDKSATENMVGRVGDLVGQWDKLREKGVSATTIVTSLGTYLQNTSGKDRNPWSGTTGAVSGAYNMTISPLSGATSATGFANQVSAGVGTDLGRANFFLQIPTVSGAPGFIGGGVYLQASFTPAGGGGATHVVTKVSAIE